MSGLVEVLGAHTPVFRPGRGCVWLHGCACGLDTAELHVWDTHVAAAVESWLAERLASDEVREAAGDALVEALNVAGWNYATAETAADEGMPAALTAITAALTQGDRR